MVLSDDEIRVMSEGGGEDSVRAYNNSFLGRLSNDPATIERMYQLGFNRTQQRLLRNRHIQLATEMNREVLRAVAAEGFGDFAVSSFLENIPSVITEQVNNIRARRPTGSLAQMTARVQSGISNTLRNRRIVPLVVRAEENPPVAILLDDRYDAPTEREDAPTERESNED